MAEFKEILTLTLQIGVPGAVLLLLVWQASKYLPKLTNALWELIATLQKAVESNSAALDTLATQSDKSNSNHVKTHASIGELASAIQAQADLRGIEESTAVKPHLQRVKQILDK